MKRSCFSRAVCALLVFLLCFEPVVWAAPSVTFLHNDVAGSPIAATDEAGNVVWRESYRPYGERTRNDAAAANNEQFFHGKPVDADSGLSYFGARYYDPVVGRFMGNDPVGFSDENVHSFNRYAYGSNNPYKYRDPDGKMAALVYGALALGTLVALGSWIASHPIHIPNSSGSDGYAFGPAANPTTTSPGLSDKLRKLFTSSTNQESSGGDSEAPQIHDGQQGKHVPGHNNFQPGKSELTDSNPQGLLEAGAGTGVQVGTVPLGQPGSKERVDFGKNIGTYVDPTTGQRSPTSVGIIHNGSRGSHIVPARPGS